MGKRLVITVDGPAGVGKSTVSMRLATKMSYIYLDTGALYRAIAFKIRQSGFDLDDERKLYALCAKTDISLEMVNDGMRVMVGGKDITEEIRTEEIGALASRVSAIPVVREALLPMQREAGKKGGIIAEGRDMGTVVFPDADIKFFLCADVRERARRRQNQLLEKEIYSDYLDIQKGLEKRDGQDTERSISPLKPAEDAFIIDTTHLGIDGVTEEMMRLISKKNEVL